MYGNVIGPYAPGNSLYNRYAQNKETVAPRSATARVSYDKIKPFRPVVESRVVPKQSHTPAPERPMGYNLFRQPAQENKDPAEGQQFKPAAETSEGILPATTENVQSGIKMEVDNPPVFDRKNPGLKIITGVKDSPDAGMGISQQSVTPPQRPLNTRDNVIGDTGFTPLFTPSTTESVPIGGKISSNGLFSERRSSAPSIMNTGPIMNNSVETAPVEDTGVVPGLSNRSASKYKITKLDPTEEIIPGIIGDTLEKVAAQNQFLAKIANVPTRSKNILKPENNLKPEKPGRTRLVDMSKVNYRKMNFEEAKNAKNIQIAKKRKQAAFVSENILLPLDELNATINANGDATIRQSQSPSISPIEIAKSLGLSGSSESSSGSSSGSNRPEKGFGLARPSVGPIAPSNYRKSSTESSSGPDIPPPSTSKKAVPKKVVTKKVVTKKKPAPKKPAPKRSARYKKAKEAGESSGSNYSDK